MATISELYDDWVKSNMPCQIHHTHVDYCQYCNSYEVRYPRAAFQKERNIMSTIECCETHGIVDCLDCGHPAPNPNPMFQGYRKLNSIEIARINRLKVCANDVHNLCKDMAVTIMTTEGEDMCEPDPRWIAIAETHLQQGFMALTRAIAKPTTF